MTRVVCGCCGVGHPRVFSESATQAVGCAAEVSRGHLVGHYGSAVADMEVYAFTGQPLPDGTLMCDRCILEWIDDGRLTLHDRHGG